MASVTASIARVGSAVALLRLLADYCEHLKEPFELAMSSSIQVEKVRYGRKTQPTGIGSRLVDPIKQHDKHCESACNTEAQYHANPVACHALARIVGSKVWLEAEFGS